MRKTKDISIAFLIYAPTLVLIPQTYVYIAIAFIGLLYWMFTIKTNGLKKDDLIFLSFLFVTILFYYVGKPYAESVFSKSHNEIFPYSIFIVLTISFSKLITKNIIRYILFFIIIEVIIGGVQYFLGVRFFISPFDDMTQTIGDTGLFYNNSVLGFSLNTSVFSLKIFTGVLFVYYLKFTNRTKILLYLLLLFGLLISFNRTAILSSVFFASLVFMKYMRKANWRLKIATFLGVLFLLFLFFHYFDLIENQFFRGRDEVDLSGRDFIFPHYINFIREHPIFGNLFTKYWVMFDSGFIYHAHNSFLQTFANMGLVIGSLVFVYILSKIKKFNYLFILPILLYSGYQYGILWGVSYLDIIFFYFLLKPPVAYKSQKSIDH